MEDRRGPLAGVVVGLYEIVGNVLGECHDPCTLNISFVDFTKSRHVVIATTYLMFRPLPHISLLHSCSQCSLLPVFPIPSLFLLILDIDEPVLVLE